MIVMSCAVMSLPVLVPAAALAQRPAPDVRTADSVTLAAGAHYRAGGLHRWLFGGAYRDLWTRPIRVPVLNLRTFDGGLTTGKAGGGQETKSLRFAAPDGVEFNFRSVDKDQVTLGPAFSDVGFVNRFARDQLSGTDPATSLMVGPLLNAVGVLHEVTAFVVMPDDTLLGKHRKVFAHRLGTIALFPTVQKGDARGWAGAIDIIHSDSLLQLIDRDPAERVDAPAFLAARLMNMLVGDYDRHPGQWKWARLQPAGAWEPIARDFDKAFKSVTGVIPRLLKLGMANMITFDSNYSGMRGLTYNSFALDQRLLCGLARPTWDSVARALVGRVTDLVIEGAMQAIPAEYQSSAPALSAKLRMRRDSLPVIADRFYRYLSGVVDLHATDAADRATVTGIDDRYLEVRLQASDGSTYFLRRFDARETSAIRLYLHGGDDEATVVGDVPSSIALRIIGGNGTNRLFDSSGVGGESGTAHFYDVGTVTDVGYGEDTLFNRRPLVWSAGGPVELEKDHGAGLSPLINIDITHDMGIIPSAGISWRRDGFRQFPYSSKVSLEGQYSFKNRGAAVALTADQRREASALHFTELVRMSELAMLNWHGLGNSSPEVSGLAPGVSAPRTDYFALHQRQWLVQPAIALALGATSDLRFGPVLKYSVTDSTPFRLVSATLPYGAGRFGEAGLRVSLSHDNRFPAHHARRGTVLDLSADYFPAVWDVRSTFGSISALGAVYFTIPVPLHPFVALRGGARKVYGDFPFQDAAFIGGRSDVRSLDPQRYAGDAALYATAEFRLPVASFTVVLPLDVGLLATEDVGRVYVKGDSPGGWHNDFGAGFYVAFHDIAVTIKVFHQYEVGRPAGLGLSFAVPGVIR